MFFSLWNKKYIESFFILLVSIKNSFVSLHCRFDRGDIFLIKILKRIKAMVKINNVQYMTVHEYAKEKCVTIQTVYNWIKDKQVETKKLMNMTLIRL